jgi:predicted Zn-dependent peptidase
MVDCYRYTENPNCLADDWARYEAVTPEDVLRVAKTYLINAERTTLSVVPKGDTDSALSGATKVELP